MPKQAIGPNQRRWLDALRSGKYRQNTEAKLCIHRDGVDSFCCLGVACETFGLPRGTPDQLGRVPYLAEYQIHAWGSLPDEACHWLGTHDSLGHLKEGFDLKGDVALAYANDRGRTFAEIADFCEQHPEAVFTEPR